MLRSFLKDRKTGYIVFELFAIIFSLFLAMWLNDWRETRNTEKLVARALSNVRKDIIQNKTELVNALEHQRNTLIQVDNVLSFLAEGKDLSAGFEWNGIRLPDLLSASFDVMKSSNLLSHVDYDIARELTSCFTFQGDTKRLTDSFIQGLMYNPDLITKFNKDTFIYLKAGIQTIVITNFEHLLQKYETSLEELDKLD
ncbi:MAG: hypothetical protein GY863_19360, partial [bacterium]|nr:hypothetical protein [bacterium]